MVSEEQIDEAIEAFDAGDMLLVQNETSNVAYAIEKAKEHGMVTAFNPAPINEKVFSCNIGLVDYLLLNEVEGKALAGCESEDPEEIKKALKEKYPDTTVVLTLGEGGSILFSRDVEIHQDIFPVTPVDTTAAGDTFCGFFLAALTRGMDQKSALKLASAASAIAVTRNGAAPSVPSLSEAMELCGL